jgi:PIN domain nuclease of toxin-antitoxin system
MTSKVVLNASALLAMIREESGGETRAMFPWIATLRSR